MKERKPSIGGGLLIAVGFIFLGVFIILPLYTIFVTAFREGPGVYFEYLADPDMQDAIIRTLVITLGAVSINVVFGVAAAWLLSKFKFPGRSLVLAVIDAPFAVSPIIIGLVFILVFGKYGWLGGFFDSIGFPIIFSWPGLLLTNIFITLPYVVREVLPVMEALGNEEEEAAVTLGAGGWNILFRITLPKIKWALFYGIVLALARGAGEFGAASVVSGLLRGQTVTLPIHIEIMYNEYMTTGAFVGASLFSLFAVIALLLKIFLGRKIKHPGLEADQGEQKEVQNELTT